MNLFMTLMRKVGVFLATNFGTSSEWSWVDDLTAAIENVIAPVLGVVAAAGLLYAIVIGIQMARADNADQREEAKKRLIAIIVAVAIMIVLVLFFAVLFDDIIGAILAGKIEGTENISNNSSTVWQSVKNITMPNL